jgi:hypothetical protein
MRMKACWPVLACSDSSWASLPLAELPHPHAGRIGLEHVARQSLNINIHLVVCKWPKVHLHAATAAHVGCLMYQGERHTFILQVALLL